MKRLLLLSIVIAIITVQPIAAQWLSVGDTVAVISPSSATDTATINGGVRTLQSWGFPCVVAPHALDDYRGFAGTADERLSDLLWALRAPHVRAVMCSRGGDGAVQLLCQLPPDTLRRYAKPIIGFSDVTALLSAQASVGVQGIHGSMCHAIATYHGNDTVSQALRHMMLGDMPVYKLPPHALNQQGSFGQVSPIFASMRRERPGLAFFSQRRGVMPFVTFTNLPGKNSLKSLKRPFFSSSV